MGMTEQLAKLDAQLARGIILPGERDMKVLLLLGDLADDWVEFITTPGLEEWEPFEAVRDHFSPEVGYLGFTMTDLLAVADALYA